MTSKKDIIHMAREAGFSLYRDISAVDGSIAHLERFAELVAAAKREQVAAWMMQRGYATGHGNTIEDLLQELEWQVAEREREACAKVCEELFADVPPYSAPDCAFAIRARGDDAP
jgi:hypothetical protein